MCPAFIQALFCSTGDAPSTPSKREKRIKRSSAKTRTRASPYFSQPASDELADNDKKPSKPRLSGGRNKRPRHLQYPDFVPPISPYNLVQEQLYSEPWKLLIATIFLNRTTGCTCIHMLTHTHTINTMYPWYPLCCYTGTAALPVLWDFFKLYPTPEAAIRGDPKEIAKLMNPLGLHEKRAQIIMKFSG